MESLKHQLNNILKQYKYVALILVLGLMLMLLPEKPKEEPANTTVVTQETDNAEEQLEDILSQIQGVGRVRVLLTVSRGEQVIYVYDEDRSDTAESESERREAVVITDGNREQTGLVSQVVSPTYLGAVVVCQGGDRPDVRLAVVDAVCNATGLTANKISVLKMK